MSNWRETYLGEEWNTSRNVSVDVESVLPKSNKKFWWKCKNGHEWQSSLANRTRSGKRKPSGCPYCSGYYASKENNLAVIYPELMKEWDFEKNKGIDPNLSTCGSSKKVYWKCIYGHEWKASINERVGHKTGCPQCNNKCSAIECRVYCELLGLFENVVWCDKRFGVEIDVYIPEFKIGIEIDGSFWHKDKVSKDKNKNKLLNKNGVRVIRLRGFPLSKISNDDICFDEKHDLHSDVLVNLVNKVSEVIGKELNYIPFINNDKFVKTISERLPKKSLSSLLPKNGIKLKMEVLIQKMSRMGQIVRFGGNVVRIMSGRQVYLAELQTEEDVHIVLIKEQMKKTL